MAKGLQIRRGKVGNEIYYKLTNSSNKDAQGVRVYQPNVTNPRTVRQCSQRMKLMPAVAFYRALAGLLDHSWQGIKYGSRSHAEFTKHALLMQEGFPFVTKGDMTPYPGSYLISSGGLVSPQITDFTSQFPITTNLKAGSFASSSNTLGEISSSLIKENPFLQEGDQLTFIAALPVAPDSVELDLSQGIYYRYARLILHSDSTYSGEDWEHSTGFALWGETDSGLGFRVDDRATMVLGAAVILSRPPRVDGGSWQRSTTRFALNPLYANVLMGDDAYNAAIESYKKSQSALVSDWYLNQGDSSDNTSNIGSALLTQAQITIGSSSFYGAFLTRGNSSKLIVGPLSGTSRIVYKYNTNTSVAEAGTFAQTDIATAVGSNYTLLSTAQNYIPGLTVAKGDDERP